MKKADLNVCNKIKVAATKFNTHLKQIAKKNGINKKVTMHIAATPSEILRGMLYTP